MSTVIVTNLMSNVNLIKTFPSAIKVVGNSRTSYMLHQWRIVTNTCSSMKHHHKIRKNQHIQLAAYTVKTLQYFFVVLFLMKSSSKIWIVEYGNNKCFLIVADPLNLWLHQRTDLTWHYPHFVCVESKMQSQCP